VEAVEVINSEGQSNFYPNMEPRVFETTTDYLNKGLGLNLSGRVITGLLNQMSLSASLEKDGKTITVAVPVTRSDVFHACDVLEDLAIAYGYDNMKIEPPKTLTVGKQTPINKLSDLIRLEAAMGGFSEILTMALCSRSEIFSALLREDDGSAVIIANPQTLEFEVVRNTLLVGLLKTIAHNRQASLPLNVFEVSDVSYKTNTTDVGAMNNRKLCAVHCANTSGFEVIHGLLDQVMTKLKIVWVGEGQKSPVTQIIIT